MKIFLSQQNYHIGNFEQNTARIIADIRAAKRQGGDLIVFSELSICGYPPQDFLEFDDFIEKGLQAVEEIKEETDNIAVLVGAPSRNPKIEGKDLFNSAFFLYGKEVKQIINKTLLPTYDIFDEYRHFEPANDWHVVRFKGKKLAITICEDIWDMSDNPLYLLRPMDMLMEQEPDVMINLSASPFDYIHAENRETIVRKNVQRYRLPMVYCNTTDAQTDIVFDGGSLVMNAKGEIINQLPYFEEALSSVTLNEDNSFREAPLENLRSTGIEMDELPKTFDKSKNIALVHRALLQGIRDYFGKLNFKEAIVASSGGIDSAVVLAVASEALGANKVRALLMPSQFSSDHSVTDAEQLSKTLNNRYDTIAIADIFGSFDTALEPIFGDLPFSIAEENLQSRIRGALVMALANKFGYILLNTSNKSELCTGYGTLYGDMAGGLSVIGDLYKEQVYELARYINRNGEIIPENIIEKAPSAELRPDQKDSDSLPPYDVMDPILYQYIERKKGPREIAEMGFDKDIVARILKMVNTNEYKRFQFCPIIRISPKGFGNGRRVPIVGKYLG